MLYEHGTSYGAVFKGAYLMNYINNRKTYYNKIGNELKETVSNAATLNQNKSQFTTLC